MSSTLTVWTSAATSHAKTRVSQIISETRVGLEDCDSISIAKCDTPDIIGKLHSAYNRLVNMMMSDSTLHIIAVIPLYEDDSLEQIQMLYDSCASLDHNISLHILGFAPGIQHLFSANIDVNQSVICFKSSTSLLKLLCEKNNFSISFSIIDDYAENGAPIGFTIDSLSRYIATIQIALINDYYKILSPSLLTAHIGDNLSIGVSTLSFNRIGVTRQILGLSFIGALDNVGINDSVVDAQMAAHEAEKILDGIDNRYQKLFENSVKPLYNDKGYAESLVVAEAATILDNDIQCLKDDILSVQSNETLTLPEKEAVLALILGRDNENIRGIQYQKEGALLDDVCGEPLDLYIDAYNNYCMGSDLLPIRRDFDALKKYKWNEIENKYEESPENFKAINPLREIKRLKQEILNTTSFIREKQDELNDLLKSEEQRKNVEKIKFKWFRPKGALRDIEYKEQPLEERYIPAYDIKIKSSVDLRPYFTPVKDQLNLGACTSFAAGAMYEAMMKRTEADNPISMSPAYLYYHTNILKGRPSGGSNFHEQFEVLGTRGICREELYTYDINSPERKPSEQADKDAENHRVISAKEIVLFDGVDKSETIRVNHKLLTSALSQGYPVGISLKIFDNFGQNGAFILHPDDTADAKEDGWHAMVIVGYSEENNFYIVRNSWGSEFGDDGYCYVPTVYIDDPEYLNFACIITEISDNIESKNEDMPDAIANFAATETEIRIAAIRNAVAKIRVDLKNSQKLYAEYYKYYQRLLMQLTMPKVQNDIRVAVENATVVKFINFKERKRVLEETFVSKIKEFKRSLNRGILTLVLVSFFLGILSCLIPSLLMIVPLIVSVSLCGMTALGIKWKIRKKRRDLQTELETIAMEEKKQADSLRDLQVRFHVSGMWLSRYHRLSMEIENVYERLVAYNNSLRAWKQTYSQQIEKVDESEGQMFRNLDASPLLLQFFEQNKSAIVENVNLINLFEEYQIDPDNLELYHKRLQDNVLGSINSLMEDFNMVNYLLGDKYPYLKSISVPDEISILLNVGQPSFRNKTMNASTPLRIAMCNILNDRAKQWATKIYPLFPMMPIHLQISDPTILAIITIHPQTIDNDYRNAV